MKIPGFALSFLAKRFEKNASKKRPKIFANLEYENRLDINYAGDSNYMHCFDLFYSPKEKRKNKLIIDVHGGAYILSTRKENYIFAKEFLAQGFDFACIDYRWNDGKLSVADQIEDCVLCINYILEHLQELGLESDEIYLTGDSAGGHFALLLAEMANNKNLCEQMGLSLDGFVPRAVLVNCTVYDLVGATQSPLMSKSACKRMFGPRYSDLELMKLYSPLEHHEDLLLPVFASTCKREFLHAEAMKLAQTMKDKNDFELLDIDSDKKEIDHVHNVNFPEYEESAQVNNAMISFIEKK